LHEATGTSLPNILAAGKQKLLILENSIGLVLTAKAGHYTQKV
jgi:hypothetical protein